MFSTDAIKVLRSLASEMDDDVSYAGCICEDIGMQKADFLGHCRAFRNHGYAKLALLIDPDEGTPKGSAYVRTKKGDSLVASMDERRAQKDKLDLSGYCDLRSAY